MGNFQLDPNFEKALLRSQPVQAVVKKGAEDIAANARRITNSKTIAAGIDVVMVDQGGVVVGRVVARDFKSGWFEKGTVKMRARPFLRPAVTAAGFVLQAARRA